MTTTMAKNQINPEKSERLIPCPQGFDKFNDDWYLNTEGCIHSTRMPYMIGAEDLDFDDWFLHLMEKRWFDANTFLPAYMEACKRSGKQIVKVRMFY